MSKSTKSKKSTRSRKMAIPPSPDPQDNYVYYSLTNQPVGTSSGVLGTGSMAFNDYLMNNNIHISTGNGANNRLGAHIFLRYVDVRLFVNMATLDRVRLIIGKARDPFASVQVTNTGLTALVEGPAILQANLRGTASGPIDYFSSTSSEYQILVDTMLGADGASAVTTSSRIASFQAKVPLNVQRAYDATGTPSKGSWFIYLVSTSAATTGVTGSIRMSWANQD